MCLPRNAAGEKSVHFSESEALHRIASRKMVGEYKHERYDSMLVMAGDRFPFSRKAVVLMAIKTRIIRQACGRCSS